MARSLTDPLEPISASSPLRPVGTPGFDRRPRALAHPFTQDETSDTPEEGGAETYDAEGHLHHPQPHTLDVED